jgi:hypothetical protein
MYRQSFEWNDLTETLLIKNSTFIKLNRIQDDEDDDWHTCDPEKNGNMKKKKKKTKRKRKSKLKRKRKSKKKKKKVKKKNVLTLNTLLCMVESSGRALQSR